MSTKARFTVKDIDKGWKDIVKTVQKLQGGSAHVKVGYLGARAASAHEDESGGELTNVELGLVHEFGSADGRIPERSHLRHTFDKHRLEYEALVTKLFWATISQKYPIAKALALVGMKHAADIKNEIRGGFIRQDLSPATLAAKWAKSADIAYGRRNARTAKAKKPKEGPVKIASPKALIDTGRLVGSISYAVVTGEGSS